MCKPCTFYGTRNWVPLGNRISLSHQKKSKRVTTSTLRPDTPTAPNHRSPYLPKLHGDIVLELLGSFGPGLLIPVLQAAGKLLQNAHIARCGDSCGGGGRSGSQHLALRFFEEKLPLMSWITNDGNEFIYDSSSLPSDLHPVPLR